MARVHFIIDPVDKKIGARWPYEQKKIENIFSDFRIHLVRGRNHAEHLALSACKEGAELIVCVGGDGTLHEITNALYPLGPKAPALSIHPEFQRGSLAKSLSWRLSFTEFLNAYLQGEAQEFFIDLGCVQFTGEFGQKVRRVFLNSCSFGFASYLLHKLKNQLSMRMNRFQFVRLLGRSLPFYRVPRIKLEIDGEEIPTRPILTGFIHNTAYFREAIKLSPDSQINDGIFEFIRIDRAPWIKYLMAAFPFYAGKAQSFAFIRRSQLKKISIDALHQNRQIRIDFDGESRGYLPAEIQVLERGLRILR